MKVVLMSLIAFSLTPVWADFEETGAVKKRTEEKERAAKTKVIYLPATPSPVPTPTEEPVARPGSARKVEFDGMSYYDDYEEIEDTSTGKAPPKVRPGSATEIDFN